MSNSAQLNISNALDQYLAEEVAHAYANADYYQEKYTAINERLALAIRELQASQAREEATQVDLLAITEQHNQLTIGYERITAANNTLNNMISTVQRQNDRFRRHLEFRLRRNIPPSFEPTLRRVRLEEQAARRVRRRLDFEVVDLTDNEQ